MSAVGYDGGGPQTASGIGFKAQQELQLIQGRTATPLHGRPTTAGVADAADYSQPWAPAGRHRLASRARAAWRTFQPYWLITALSVFVAIFLYVDDRMNNIWVQRGLGLLTFTVLILCGFTMSSEQRRQLCFLVAFATCLELFSSQLWGVYRYRFGNVPLYIPPGHGVVFVMSALIARSPLVHAHPVAFKRAALSVSGGWSLAALTFLPHFTHRLDMEGALLWPIFALFVLGASSYSTFFAAVFFVTAGVELFGVACGDWAWNPVAPYLRIPGGNPPSVIAGAYCALEGSVLTAALIFTRANLGRTRQVVRAYLSEWRGRSTARQSKKAA